MVQALPKAKPAKVIYHDINLSAVAISNFANAIRSDITVTQAPKPNVKRNEFYHVELKVNPTQTINGELAIMDYIATQKNR